jgi:CRP-like cAMP-binding protein
MTFIFKSEALRILQSAELTRDMEMKHLCKLASMTCEMEFPEGEIIYRRGDMGQALYLIEEGEVVVEIDIPNLGLVAVNTFGPGQIFGWSSLFPFERKIGWTRATKPTRVLAINAHRLRAAFQFDHNLEYAVVRRAARAMVDRVKDCRQQWMAAAL